MKYIDLKLLEKKYPYDDMLSSAKDVFNEMQDIEDWHKEAVVGFFLDTRNRIISREIVSIGTLNLAIVHARKVFRTAIVRNANAVILVHNHPSGQTEPSQEDKVITRSLVKAGEILGIELLDHVIVTGQGYFSLRDGGLMRRAGLE